MIRRHVTVLRLSLMSTDALVAAAVFIAVSTVRFGPPWADVWTRLGLPVQVWIAAWSIAWVSVMWVHGLYRLRAHWSFQTDLVLILRGTMLVGILTFVGLLAADLPQVSRLFLLMLFGAQLTVAVASRLFLRTLLALAREQGLSTRFMLVVGTSPMSERFADLIESRRELGLRVIGHLGWPAPDAQNRPRRPVLGRPEDVETVLHAHVVDEVAICLPPEAWGLAEAITRICADEGKVVRVPVDGAAPHIAGATLEHYGGLVIQSLVYGPDRVLGLLAKRIIDLTGAATLLVVASPLLLGIAIAIRLRDGPPILFRQPRVGLNGRVFRVVKFRTMVPDAEDRLADLLAENEISGHAFKVTLDPRVSRTGRILRRTSLDELPQLWNVVRGEMSLVGPRPPLPGEVAGYDIWHRRRLSMKPGITGLWQVSERRNSDFDRWVAIDLDYIDRWSLWLDLKILFRTIPAMFQGR